MKLFDFFNKKKKQNLSFGNIKMNESFPELESKLIPEIKSMFEVSYEYTGFNQQEVDAIYVFNSTEYSLFFDFFFKINGKIVAKHDVNKILKQQCDISGEIQFAALDIGIKNLENITKLFKENQQEIPLRIKAMFSPKTKQMEISFSYKKRFHGLDIDERSLIEEWKSELTRNVS